MVTVNPYYNLENQNTGLTGYSYLYTIPPSSPAVLLKVMDPLDECYYDGTQPGGQLLGTYQYDPDTLAHSDVNVIGPDGSSVLSSTFLDQCSTGSNYLNNTSPVTVTSQSLGAEKYFPTTLSFTLYNPVYNLGSNFNVAAPGTTSTTAYSLTLASATTPLTPTGTTLLTNTYGIQPLYLGPEFKTGVNGTTYCHSSAVDGTAACIGGHLYSWFTLAAAQNKSTTQTMYVMLVVNDVVNQTNTPYFAGTYGAGGNVFSLGLCGMDASGADPGNPVDDHEWIPAALNSSQVGLAYSNTSPVWTPWKGGANYTGDGCLSPGLNGYNVTAREAMCIITEQTGTDSYIPLATIPESYSGGTVILKLFDPGDVSGTNELGVMSPQDKGTTSADVTWGWGPTGVGVPQSEPYNLDIASAAGSGYSNIGEQRPSFWCGAADYNADDHEYGGYTAFPVYNASSGCLQTTTTSLVTVANGGTHDFANGTWLDFNMEIPNDYATQTGNFGSNWWKMYYQLSVGGTASDTTTWEIVSGANPIHLTKLTE